MKLIMKIVHKNIFAIVISTFLLLPTACTDDFLSLAPISQYNAGQFYKTPEHMEQAVNSVYNAFLELNQVYWTSYMEMRTPMMSHSSYYHSEIHFNNFLPNTTGDVWSLLYKIIYNANVVLEKIETIEFDDDGKKQQLIGQAKFFRGWAYYGLVMMFDGVPVFTEVLSPEDAPSLPRASVADVYKQAEADLLDAMNSLPETWGNAGYGRVTKYTAKGILARVYIQQIGLPLSKDTKTQWNLALPHLNDIVNSGQYSFEPDYTVLFSSAGELSHKEVVFTAKYNEDGTGLDNKAYANQYMAYPFGRYVLTETDYAYSLYSENDIRRDHIFRTSFVDPSNNKTIDRINMKKYGYEYNAASDLLGADLVLMRYTDVLLLKAEGEAEVAGSVLATSLSVLNQVRNRAGLNALTLSDVPNMGAWRKALLDERNLEFAYECVRWPDLLRTNTYVEVLTEAGMNADVNWRYFPIPLSELQRHDKGLWQQNAGYEYIK